MGRCREVIISKLLENPYAIWRILADFGEIWCKELACDNYDKCLEDYRKLRLEIHEKLKKILVDKPTSLGPSLISLDSNPVPVGLYKTFTAGANISAGQVVSLHTDGNVYPASPSYPNVIGVALDTVSAGASVRVLVMGVAQVVADGAINPGQPVTFSTATAGRVVAYTGHSHSVSTSTATAVTGVSTSTTTVISGISTSTTNVVASVSTSTGTFVTGISVDKRNFTTASAVTGVSTSSATVVSSVTTSTGTFLTGIGNDTGWTTDSSGYIRHSHSTSTGSAVTSVSTSTASVVSSVSTSTGTFVTGITSTSGTTVVAGVSASTGSAVTGVSTSTATVVSGISTSTATVISGVSTSTGTFVTSVSLGTTLSRVIGIALTGASSAGSTITILVIPLWI